MTAVYQSLFLFLLPFSFLFFLLLDSVPAGGEGKRDAPRVHQGARPLHGAPQGDHFFFYRVLPDFIRIYRIFTGFNLVLPGSSTFSRI